MSNFKYCYKNSPKYEMRKLSKDNLSTVFVQNGIENFPSQLWFKYFMNEIYLK